MKKQTNAWHPELSEGSAVAFGINVYEQVLRCAQGDRFQYLHTFSGQGRRVL